MVTLRSWFIKCGRGRSYRLCGSQGSFEVTRGQKRQPYPKIGIMDYFLNLRNTFVIEREKTVLFLVEEKRHHRSTTKVKLGKVTSCLLTRYLEKCDSGLAHT